ncbi:lysophospholipid acyltransferase family protein [Sphaerisporangium perillae]|uniref:lysophospholipid acyltransferase family protein n=1 Tax=Sphaerisporangium perillae TaxID=2935860 RepID=UPI0020104C3D|nr:lysophospholipid acyltransferase family protein [Sphaerisporangium perillae]
MSGWLPVAPCTTRACVSGPSESAGLPRRVSRLLGAVAVVLAGLPWALVARRLGGAHGTVLATVWSRAFLRALGVRVEVRQGFTVLGGSAVSPAAPQEPGGAGVLLVANHVSWLDPLVVAAAMPCRALAKSEIARWPVIRSLVVGSGAIFIDRERLSTLPGTVRAVADALRAGHSVVAFPEGTTWCGRGGGPFRPAVFQAAIDARAAVRPIALRFRDRNGRLATGPSFVGDDTLLASLARVVSARGLVVEVTVFPVLAHPRAGEVTRRALADIARATVSGERPRRNHVPAAA